MSSFHLTAIVPSDDGADEHIERVALSDAQAGHFVAMCKAYERGASFEEVAAMPGGVGFVPGEPTSVMLAPARTPVVSYGEVEETAA